MPPSPELLATAIAASLLIGLLFSESFGLAAGGLLASAYLAVVADRPWEIATALSAALAAFGLARGIAALGWLFGRRRLALILLAGYTASLAISLLRSHPAEPSFAALGGLAAGSIGVSLDRHGVREALLTLALTTSLTRLCVVSLLGSP